jgi:hypothetical protein
LGTRDSSRKESFEKGFRREEYKGRSRAYKGLGREGKEGG